MFLFHSPRRDEAEAEARRRRWRGGGEAEIYFALGITEGRPAGGFLADKIVFCAKKASRRGLFGGMTIFQRCFKSSFDSRFRVYAKFCED